MQSFPTIGTIAEQLCQPVHRIRYVLQTRRIQPSGRAGNARVFTDADIERVQVELARIDRAREGTHA